EDKDLAKENGEDDPQSNAESIADGEDDIVLEIEKDDNDYLANLTEEEKSKIYDPHLDLPRYEKPSLSLLEDYRNRWFEVTRDELENNKRRIVNALASYKIRVDGISAKMGPTVTLYKVRLAEGVRVAQVKKLEEDIAISLVAKGVRIVPLSDSVGIEVANEKPSVVPLKSILNSPQFKEASEKMELPVAMGITVTNEPFFFDLAKMPHLLVAGATGMGKSVGLNAIITSLLYAMHPSEMKLVMVDPKKVELDFYSKLENHFLAKLPDSDEAVITDTTKVVYTLKSLCIEMDDRYDLLKAAGVRKITEYNPKFLQRKLNPLKGHKYLPYIVVIIDEFADLLMTAGREIEEPIARLAQKARAVGIHLVIATQRPTTNIITGTIKANFNSRIAFKVNASVDSKTILDQPGANRLIGRGDMLVTYPGIDLTRVQCALIETDEVTRLTDFIGKQQGYPNAMYLPEYSEDEEGGEATSVDLSKRDKLFDEAAKIVVQYQQGSTSLLQRKLNLGYNRAGRLIDQLEAAGIVGPFGGSKARDVLVTDFDQLDRILENL
ncbi:MAG: DNA translocase FtsK, partial [Bacteroidales bacterium]|nr:DNA translocase FtsK [Bacteroidales bacterium]